MKRRTIQFTAKDQIEVVEEAVPSPADGQVLVETTRSLISTGTELICLTRNFAEGTHWHAWVKYPFGTGYLNAGRVVEVGASVKDWKVGDRVASRGQHSSHVIVAAEKLVRIPENVSDEEGAWTGLGKITQVGVRTADQKLGDSVVVIGLGLLGQLVVQYARILGAGQVIAIDTAPKRLEMAAAHGATHTLNMTAGAALKNVEEITQGRRADVVYDVTGHAAVLATALPLARAFGTLLLLGDTGTPGNQTLTMDVVARGVRIVGAHDSHAPEEPAADRRWTGKRMHELFLTYLSRGQMRVKDLITHRYKPEAAREAYSMLLRDRSEAMGVVFEWK